VHNPGFKILLRRDIFKRRKKKREKKEKRKPFEWRRG